MRRRLGTAKAQARFPGGQAPLGYRRSIGGALRVVEREAGVVRRIFREYPRQGSLGNLATWLKKEGVRNRGKDWTRQTLAWILRNPVYVGTIRIAGRRWRDACEPIVNGRAFAAAGRLLAEKCRNGNRRRNHETPPLLASPAAKAAQHGQAAAF